MGVARARALTSLRMRRTFRSLCLWISVCISWTTALHIGWRVAAIATIASSAATDAVSAATTKQRCIISGLFKLEARASSLCSDEAIRDPHCTATLWTYPGIRGQRARPILCLIACSLLCIKNNNNKSHLTSPPCKTVLCG
jgi:hypothetical protein